jgi:hypothetical protein
MGNQLSSHATSSSNHRVRYTDSQIELIRRLEAWHQGTREYHQPIPSCFRVVEGEPWPRFCLGLAVPQPHSPRQGFNICQKCYLHIKSEIQAYDASKEAEKNWKHSTRASMQPLSIPTHSHCEVSDLGEEQSPDDSEDITLGGLINLPGDASLEEGSDMVFFKRFSSFGMRKASVENPPQSSTSESLDNSESQTASGHC